MNCGTDYGVLDILEKLDFQKSALTGVVYLLVRKDNTSHIKCLRVLHTLGLVIDDISRHEYDLIILPCLEHNLPMVWSKADTGWAENIEDLAGLIAEHWKSELLIIAVS